MGPKYNKFLVEYWKNEHPRPCKCLLRKPFRTVSDIKLTGFLKGWHAKTSCMYCKGTGMTERAHAKSSYDINFDYERIVRENKRKIA